MKHLGEVTKINGYEIPIVDVVTGGSPKYRVYKYTFPNGMIYIGVTQHSIQKRRDCGYQHNRRLTEAYRRCGWKNVKTEILYETEIQADAFEKEKTFIKEYGSTDPLKGYNVSLGGKATYEGLKHTDAYRKRMSSLYKGKTYSEETLNRMKASHAKERNPVICFDESGREIKRYESLHEAAAEIGGYPANISRACKSHKAYKNFYWKCLKEKGG